VLQFSTGFVECSAEVGLTSALFKSAAYANSAMPPQSLQWISRITHMQHAAACGHAAAEFCGQWTQAHYKRWGRVTWASSRR
ncbi:MAG: hypothetical protein ACK56F_03340, partial [bacterium]